MSATFQADELWRQIPPEEKIELLSRAHSVGVFTALITILIGGTLAVGLHLKWFLWGSLLAAPLAFQFAAGRSWRSLRPRVMLEYLAAKSAARRFAFAAKAKELGVKLIFRGHIEEVFEADQLQEALEATVAKTREAAVWVALFDDAVVMLSEKIGGAEAQFAQVITDKLEFEVKNQEGASDYSADKEFILGYENKVLGSRRVKLTSRYPAAMIVFEKTLIQKKKDYLERKKLETALPVPADLPPLEEEAY